MGKQVLFVKASSEKVDLSAYEYDRSDYMEGKVGEVVADEWYETATDYLGRVAELVAEGHEIIDQRYEFTAFKA